MVKKTRVQELKKIKIACPIYKTATSTARAVEFGRKRIPKRP